MITEGTFLARAINASDGVDGKTYTTVRIRFEILKGPSVGQEIDYNGRLDARSAPYIAKDMKAAGWAGKTIKTIAADVERTHVEVPIEIQHKQTKDGARTFAVVRSIGGGAAPLTELSGAALAEADALLGAAGGAGSASDEIPFISCNVADDVNPIASVLR